MDAEPGTEASEVKGGTVGEVRGDTVSEVRGDTVSEVRGDTVSEVRGDAVGEVSEVGGDAVSEVKGDTVGEVSEVRGDAVSEVKGDTVGEVRGDTVSEVRGDTVSEVRGDTVSEVTGDAVGEVKGDTVSEVRGDTMGEVKGDTVGEVSKVRGDAVSEVKGDTVGEVSKVRGDAVSEVKGDTVGEVKGEEDSSPITVAGEEKEGVPAEMVASDQEAEDTEEASAEEAVSSEPVGSGANELSAADAATTAEELDERPQSHEGSVVFEIDSNDEAPRLHLDTPEREASPAGEEEGEAEEAAPPADSPDIDYEEHLQLQQQLCEQRDEASQRSVQLQTKLADYLSKRAGEDGRPERELPESEQLREYEKCVKVLADLKQRLATDSETAQQQADGLSSQARERLDKVENEWREFVALKQDVAVVALSRHLGKQAAQAKVEAVLAAEQLLQDQLIKLRLRHIKLKIQIQRLEAELRDGDDHAGDPLHFQFEQLQAARLEQKKQAEKQKEEALKVQKKISSSLELLSNVKEKLFWSQTEVQAKRRQLAELEAAVARKREILTRTKQARNGLQKDNLRLKESRGLLGNRVLLRDFEDTVDASSQLEERLENLKARQAEIVFSCGR